MSRARTLLVLTLAAMGCTTASSPRTPAASAPTRQQVTAALDASFTARGQAKMDRLHQDETQAFCSGTDPKAPLPAADVQRLQAQNLAGVKYPADNVYMGDWREGERIAQSGVGKQFSDDPSRPAGGNCYACHQLAAQELSFGTIGPSLQGYGKQRGATPEIQRYVFARIYNPQAFSACSQMPRFGAHGILTEAQIKHVVALLLDPSSPVNR